MMTVDDNKRLVHAFFDAWNHEPPENLRRFFAADMDYHALPYGFAPGPDGVVQYYRMVRSAFPDLHVELEMLIGEENKIATRLCATGTHHGQYFGLAPTGRQARYNGTQICTLRDGQIVEMWSIWDRLGLLRQLGFLPEHPTAGVELFPEGRPALLAPEEEIGPETVARNKQLVRRLIEEVLNQGRLEVADEIVTEDYVGHPFLPGQPPGRDGLKHFAHEQHVRAPDWHNTIEEIVAEGDKVVLRATGRGTPTDSFLGMPPGKWIAVPWIHTFRIAHGQIVERWTDADWLGALAQIGALPPFRHPDSH